MKGPPPTAGSAADPVWDAQLDAAPFAFVDLEMTGLDPSLDRICEVCVIRTNGEVVVAELESLVRPDSRAGENAQFHGLDAEALAAAPPFADVAQRVHALLDGALLVAHAAEHDHAFLEAELGRAGLAPSWVGVLDTLPLSRRAFALPSHKLGALALHLGIPLARAHRAGDDARATMALFFRVAAVLAARSARDLWHVRVGERHPRPEVLEAAREAVASGAVVCVRYRASRRAAEDIPMVITAVQGEIEPPRVLGYVASSRGRKELRSDRILSITAVPVRD